MKTAVALCTREIVEVELGHATEEPRLVEIGLGRDGLIEILDGEDIVLVVEFRPSDGHQLVGIELGKGKMRNNKKKKSPPPTPPQGRGV